MTKRVAIMLADGFEPIEAMAPTDCLRRAGAEVALVSVMPVTSVVAAHDIAVEADVLIDGTDLGSFDMIIIPGGGVGVENLKKSAVLADALKDFMAADKFVAAICAGPTVLNKLGLLEGKRVTCYPSCEEGFPEGAYQPGFGVVVDGNLITASGPGQAIEFGIAVVSALCGEDVSNRVASDMLIC